jgi:putative sterol carrier protein
VPYDPITSLSSIRSELESGWKLFDQIWAPFGPKDWARKFGRTWTYADQPYHMAYFDGTLGRFLVDGPEAPPNRLHMRSLGEINDWNAREFAKRPAGQTVEESIKAMHASRDMIRRHVEAIGEKDLDRRAWMPLLFGWVTARAILQGIVVHNVAEYWKLWLRTGQRTPAPSPSAVHLRLGFMMNFMPTSMNRKLATSTRFTMTWNFNGPGGGPWTFAVADGTCRVTETTAPNADLVITMKPETFHKLIAKMTPPPILMLTGQMRVKGITKMGLFGRLFPEPKSDQIIEPPTAFAAG